MVPRNTETKYKTIEGKRTRAKGSRILVPEAGHAMDNLKRSIASEMGIDFSTEDKGNYTAKQCGQVGGEMVRRIIEQMKLEMLRSGPNRFQQ